MTNSKLQAALDELERLRDTVKAFKQRNGALPYPDSDAGRAVSLLRTFTCELDKLSLRKLLKSYNGIGSLYPFMRRLWISNSRSSTG